MINDGPIIRRVKLGIVILNLDCISDIDIGICACRVLSSNHGLRRLLGAPTSVGLQNSRLSLVPMALNYPVEIETLILGCRVASLV